MDRARGRRIGDHRPTEKAGHQWRRSPQRPHAPRVDRSIEREKRNTAAGRKGRERPAHSVPLFRNEVHVLGILPSSGKGALLTIGLSPRKGSDTRNNGEICGGRRVAQEKKSSRRPPRHRSYSTPRPSAVGAQRSFFHVLARNCFGVVSIPAPGGAPGQPVFRVRFPFGVLRARAGFNRPGNSRRRFRG